VSFSSSSSLAILMLYYFPLMLRGAKPEARSLVHNFAPFAIFFPSFWDESGNKARVRFLILALVFGICFGGSILIKAVLMP
jgi:hypothetical protein